MKVAPITPDAFNRSIELALENPPDADSSAARIKLAIKELPEGALYYSNYNQRVSFYIRIDGRQKYLSKKNKLIYRLARKKYLLLLLNILELTGSKRSKDIERRRSLISKLQALIRIFANAKLDIERIVLSEAQYKWFRGSFNQKRINEEEALKSSAGIPLRSKSERDIMNSVGSVWTTYDSISGNIRMFNDFRIMLADGSVIIWKHEGLYDDFVYRRNAQERVYLLRSFAPIRNLTVIETLERDIDTPQKREERIKRDIIPRLWF